MTRHRMNVRENQLLVHRDAIRGRKRCRRNQGTLDAFLTRLVNEGESIHNDHDQRYSLSLTLFEFAFLALRHSC